MYARRSNRWLVIGAALILLLLLLAYVGTAFVAPGWAKGLFGGNTTPTPTPSTVSRETPVPTPPYRETPVSTPVTRETPVDQPTPISGPVEPPSPANIQPCVSEAQVHADLKLPDGVKVVKTGDQWSTPTEPCKFQIQAVGIGHVQVTMAQKYQFTATMNPGQEIRVFYGDNVVRDIQGATVRYLNSYPADHWVWKADRLISHEFNFGIGQGRNPRYTTQPGNFNVADWNGYDGTTCPVTKVQLAALVGEEPMYWTLKDWEGGAHVYKVSRDGSGNPVAFHVLTAAQVPNMNAWLDYWNSKTNSADRLDNWATLPLADASYHCHPK